MTPYNPNTMEPTEEGIFDIEEPLYHRIRAFNYSSMKILHDMSPRHLKARMDGLSKPITPQLQARFDFGSAVDLGIFEPDRFDAEVTRAPTGKGWSKNSIKYKEWADVHKEDIILTKDAYARARGVVREVKKKNTAMALLESGWPQKSVLWRHPEFGFWCKCRPDWIVDSDTDPVVVDLKTTENASRWKFIRQIERLKYYWQAYWYLSGLTAVTGVKHRKWRWLVTETYPPHESNVFVADPSEIEATGNSVWLVCEKYAQCIDKDEWPGYPDEPVELGFEYEYPEEFDPEEEIPF
jgi:hypothetical protein